MLTRETHARIYQGEITDNEYSKLKSSGKEESISLRELILETVRKYLEDWETKYSLDIEKVVLNNGSVRFYLWLPYQVCDKIDQLMKNRGTYVQELVRKAIWEYNKTDRENIAE